MDKASYRVACPQLKSKTRSDSQSIPNDEQLDIIFRTFLYHLLECAILTFRGEDLTVKEVVGECAKFAIRRSQLFEFLNMDKHYENCEQPNDQQKAYNQAYCLDVCMEDEILSHAKSNKSFER